MVLFIFWKHYLTLEQVIAFYISEYNYSNAFFVVFHFNFGFDSFSIQHSFWGRIFSLCRVWFVCKPQNACAVHIIGSIVAFSQIDGPIHTHKYIWKGREKKPYILASVARNVKYGINVLYDSIYGRDTIFKNRNRKNKWSAQQRQKNNGHTS